MFLLFSAVFAKEKGMVYIGGTIKQFRQGEITIYYIKDYLYNQKILIKKLQTDKHGKFELTFPWEISWEVQMKIGDAQFTYFLSPGDSLIIKANNLFLQNSIKYSGNAGPGHNAMKQYFKEFSKKNDDFRKKMIKFDSAEFITLNNQYHTEQMDSISKDSIAIHGKNFYEYLKAIVNYNYYNNIFAFNKMKRNLFDTTYLVSQFSKSIVDNEYALSLPDYLVFLDLYIAWKSEVTKSAKDKNNYWDYRYRTIKRALTGKVRDIMLARTVRKAFQFANHTTAMLLYYDYKNVYVDQNFVAQIKNEFIH
jgi:hypothetical protein